VHHVVSCVDAGDPSAIVDLAVAADAAGWDGFFLWDHLAGGMAGDFLDPWVLLGAAARATEDIRLGTMITPLPRRRPWVVAKQLLTLDHLSGGRAVLGAGLGYPESEYSDFGEDRDGRRRGALLDEGLEVVAAACEHGAVDHDGDHFHVHSRVGPPSVQRPRPPIWLAATAPHRRPLERARRYDGVVPISADSAPLMPDQLAAYVGADPGIDVIAFRDEDATAAEYADVGATWLISGVEPGDDWLVRLRRVVAEGPPT
jgi:alkanesulfonate monooxygenase SsuD/methylene tetrahydromethanopterin reductase-like flavin-dependent oxidoreductase (luciferase family)